MNERPTVELTANGSEQYWTRTPPELAELLQTDVNGLRTDEASRRLEVYGYNELSKERGSSATTMLFKQFRSPLVLLLLFAACVSMLSGEWIDAGIVIAIVFASVAIGTFQEYKALLSIAKLRSRLRINATAFRDGAACPVPSRSLVPGDVVLLSAGTLVPADGILLSATDLCVNEAVLTGESFPVTKRPGVARADATLPGRFNCVFMGTNVRSGFARCLVLHTGMRTHYGAIAGTLAGRTPETDFDRGIRHFGNLLVRTMLVMVGLVFVVNVVAHRPAIETLLFSLALAVGLSPELLPAILTINLAHGAERMARNGVLVRHLHAIENLGSMDVLCTDKTGTLTEGTVRLKGAFDSLGQPSSTVLELASVNAGLQAGLANPLDQAILEARPLGTVPEKLGEIPYDFERKRLSVVVGKGVEATMVSKGAVSLILDVCTRTADNEPLDANHRSALESRFQAWAEQGVRVLALATRTLERRPSYSPADERDLTFQGFLTFFDPPKAGVAKTLRDLCSLGVDVKLITGDTGLVALHVATAVGMRVARSLDGKAIDALDEQELQDVAQTTDLFVEVDPNQKERIVRALRRSKHVVGFMGDGINDAPAMHAADTSLSVDDAVDVAKEAADFVLLERDLDVIRAGIEEGRRTFANTMKYVLTTTSANLGNMISMAVASVFLPFLPLLASQILLNNFLSDIPAIGLAGDNVDREQVERPQRWNMRFILRFMLVFGTVSSLFDFVTFWVLLTMFTSGAALFRTGWFVESLLTELLVALVVRTRRSFFHSRPGKLLMIATGVVVLLTFLIPYSPIANRLGFVPLPGVLMLTIAAIALAYVCLAEITKRFFYRGNAANAWV